MKTLLRSSGYVFDLANGIWLDPGFRSIAYSDGDEAETRIARVVMSAGDLSVLSAELRTHCTDWPSLYHLSPLRANLLRPFKRLAGSEVLEIGAGCGAITRYLGEVGATVLAVEGSARRATIARSRTRDLANVTVVAESFAQLRCGHRFDVVTLIGVLEYAALFDAGPLPFHSLLARARDFLKPSGTLLLAIENQFGLKYFAGAPEDHLGQPMIGLEGGYLDGQPRTFGRLRLSRMLAEAGFEGQRFYSAMPDYKLPVSLVSEDAAKDDRFDASALAWQSVRRDPQLPTHCGFAMELAWPGLYEAGLGIDLANGWLVECAMTPDCLPRAGALAFHYSTDRRPEYCREAVFAAADGRIEVRYGRVGRHDDRRVACPQDALEHRQVDADRYRSGLPLSMDLLRTFSRNGWKPEQLSRFVWRYLAILEGLSNECGMPLAIDSPEVCLPGELFDAIPQNIIVEADGRTALIDREWAARFPLEVGYLLVRAVLSLTSSISRIGVPDSGQPSSNEGLVAALFESAGFQFDSSMLARYLHQEAVVQQQVTGRDFESSLAEWAGWRIPTILPSQALAQRIGEVEYFKLQLATRNDEFVSLNAAIAQRNEEVSRLSAGILERDARELLLRTLLSERDGAIVGLEKQLIEVGRKLDEAETALSGRLMHVEQLEAAITDKDLRITELAHSGSLQSRRIAEIESAMAVVTAQRDEVLGSNSWKLTAPIRTLRRALVSRPAVVARRAFAHVAMRVWSVLPISIERKLRLRARLVGRFPALLDLGAARPMAKFPDDAIFSSGHAADALESAAPGDAQGGEVGNRPAYVPRLNADHLKDSPARLVAFYLPQFHAIPENDAWWGKGFTEWTNVRRAKPQFRGQYQPRIPGELGYYDLLNPEVQRRQVELAQLYGIQAFCFYFYWFGGKTLLEQPVRNYLADKSLALSFCLCWANENWTRTWDGLDNEVLIGQSHSAADDLAFIAHVGEYMKDPRYVRIGEKPLLIVYRASLLPEPGETASRWRQWCRDNGIGEICLACVQSFGHTDPNLIGFDAAIEFPPNYAGLPDVTDSVVPLSRDFRCRIYDWSKFVERSHKFERTRFPLFRGVCPSWDNTARRANRSSVLANSEPRGFQEWLHNAVAETSDRIERQDGRLVFVNAWNEWAEGAYLEPDAHYGYAFLEACRVAQVRAASRIAARRIPDPSQPVAIVIHAFYLDVLDEILAYVNKLAVVGFHLYVSCTHQGEREVRERLDAIGDAYTLLPCPNRGRDALPFLRALRVLASRGHDLLIKVHTKKSVHREDGARWREELFGELLTDEAVGRAIGHFRSHPDTGLLGPNGHVVPMSYYWGSNAARVLVYAERLGLKRGEVEQLSFAAGHMFMARTIALLPLLSIAIDEDCFEVEAGQTDGTMAHAVERLVSVSVASCSMAVRSISDVDLSRGEYRYARRG